MKRWFCVSSIGAANRRSGDNDLEIAAAIGGLLRRHDGQIARRRELAVDADVPAAWGRCVAGWFLRTDEHRTPSAFRETGRSTWPRLTPKVRIQTRGGGSPPTWVHHQDAHRCHGIGTSRIVVLTVFSAPCSVRWAGGRFVLVQPVEEVHLQQGQWWPRNLKPRGLTTSARSR